MESSQLERNSHCRIRYIHDIGDEPRYGSRKRIKQNQDPHNAEYIEDEMRQSSPPGLRIASQGGQISGNRRTDVFTQHKRDSQMIINPSVSTHNQRDSHRRGRSLHDHCQDSSDEQKQDDGQEPHVSIILYKGKHLRIGPKIRCIGF